MILFWTTNDSQTEVNSLSNLQKCGPYNKQRSQMVPFLAYQGSSSLELAATQHRALNWLGGDRILWIAPHFKMRGLDRGPGSSLSVLVLNDTLEGHDTLYASHILHPTPEPLSFWLYLLEPNPPFLRKHQIHCREKQQGEPTEETVQMWGKTPVWRARWPSPCKVAPVVGPTAWLIKVSVYHHTM